jgi:hypothetical protein
MHTYLTGGGCQLPLGAAIGWRPVQRAVSTLHEHEHEYEDESGCVLWAAPPATMLQIPSHPAFSISRKERRVGGSSESTG